MSIQELFRGEAFGGLRRKENGERSGARSSEEGRASFIVLLCSQLLGTTAFMFVVPFMPLYVQALGVEDVGRAAAWAGVINGASGATMAFVAPLWGRLSDRMGRKLMLLRATLAAVVVVGSMGFVSAPWQLLVLRLLQGTLTGTVPAATSLVAATAPEEKAGWRLGTLQTVIFIAAGVGPALGGISADAAGLRNSFFVASSLLAVSSVLILFGVKENKPKSEEAEAEDPEDTGAVERPALPYRLLMPGLLVLFAVHVSITSAGVVMPGFVGALSGAERVASQAGWIIGTGALVASLGSLLGGRLAARFGARRVMVLALAAAGLLALPQALVENVPQLWALRLATSLFIGCAIPVANLAIKTAAPPGRQGEAFGVASSATSTGFALGPVGGGLLAASIGFWSALLVPGVLLLVLAAGLVLAYAQRSGRANAAWKALIASITR
jgi:MFS transporter, DHA1 family, multidrug resistance protein